MKIIKKILILVACLVILVGCDLGTKQIANSKLKDLELQSYFGGTIQLFYTENSGGMLSFGSELNNDIKLIVFRLMVAVFLILMLGYLILKRDMGKTRMVSFILILGGGFGNLVERFVNDGKVTDFIIIEIMGIHSGIFNFADVFITVGVTILVISGIYFQYRINRSSSADQNVSL